MVPNRSRCRNGYTKNPQAGYDCIAGKSAGAVPEATHAGSVQERHRIHPLFSVPVHDTRRLRHLGNRWLFGFPRLGNVPAELEEQALRMDTDTAIDGDLREMQFG